MQRRIGLLLAAVAVLVLVVAVSTATAVTAPVAGTVPTSPTSIVSLPLIQNNVLPTPTASPTPNGPFFSDNFSDPTSGWLIDNTTDHTIGYLGGEYQILVKNPGFIVKAGHNLYATDFQVNLDARDASIIDGSNGIYFGAINSVGFYDFEVGYGQFVLYRYDLQNPNNSATLIAPTVSSAINTGNASNHLRATRSGSTITLYANGTQLAQTNDSILGGGFVGMAASSFSTPNFDVRFDNFYLVEAAPMFLRGSAGRPSGVENTATVPALRSAWSTSPR
jgi:hypothetical protein